MAIRRNGSRLANRENLVAAGREIAGLGAEEATEIVDQMFEHVSQHWRYFFEMHAQDIPDACVQDWEHIFTPQKRG